MGRVRTKQIKRLSFEIADKHAKEFGTDFDKNKEGVKALHITKEKKANNRIAGYLTRVLKSRQRDAKK